MININHSPKSLQDELAESVAEGVRLLGRAWITEVTMAEMSFVVSGQG